MFLMQTLECGCRLTVRVAEQDDEDGVENPFVNGGQVEGDHGYEQRQRPDLADHGCESELAPYLTQVGQGQHHDDWRWKVSNGHISTYRM